MKNSVRTTCAYCGVGCGIIATPDRGGWSIKGDPDHPANFGRLCSKGINLAETLSLDGRLLQPEIDGKTADWGDALSTVAAKFSEIAKNHGPESIAFYLSGQLLTEDYYVANKLAKGFIGTPHVDTNSRLCMASSVAGHKRAFGADIVPACYEDLDEADLIVLVGSNAAWCHPVLFQRMLENRRRRGAKIVTVDVRETATTRESDLALIIKPGTDAYLFNGLLCALKQSGTMDEVFVSRHCLGFEQALDTARGESGDAKSVALATGLDIEDVRNFFTLFASTDKTVSCYSLGIHMSSSGTDKVNAIINCHLATGRVGKGGAGPLSLTGQPNAMGGREVGGMANQLAAHMGYDPVSIGKVQRFWSAPKVADREGYKAIEMFDAMADGKIKAIWIMCTNPAVSLTDSLAVRRALDTCDFVVVSECITDTDTLAYANVKFPAATWGEKSGTVTNSERRISRQRSFLPIPGQAKPDWWIVSQVAKRMGYGDAFSYDNPGEIFNEHARLSGFENDGERGFDISGLSDLNAADYETLAPIQWPVTKSAPGGTARMFVDKMYQHDGNRAKFVAVAPNLPIDQPDRQFPLIATSGRVRDQWHTMSRTGKSPILSRHRSEPFIEISPSDAQAYGLKHLGLARVSSRLAETIYRVCICDGQKPGNVFLPIHWNRTNASGGWTGMLFASHTDPVSGQPEGKFIPVSVAPVEVRYTALIISRNPVDPKLPVFWSRAISTGCYLHSLAIVAEPPEGWSQRVARFLGVDLQELITYKDSAAGMFRAAHFKNGMIYSAVFISQGHEPLEEAEAERWFNSDMSNTRNRWMSLSPEPANGALARGSFVCACFGIGVNAITQALTSGDASSVEDIGRLLKAGTNCGSCVPEIRQIVNSAN